NGAMAVGGSAPITLSGPVGGAGSLVKNGASDLTLAAANNFGGGVALNAGRLVVGTNTSLGTGVLTAAAGTTLDASAPVSLANDVTLLGNLTLGGSQPMTLSGGLSGAGGIVKTGAADATLSGANSFGGAVSV
ncbi:autotransporter-associated beta strand repeat-containing protein, partial [Variovorax sp. KK3]